MEFPFTVLVKSEDDTTKLANEFSRIILEGDVVILNGNLGTGKTFFIKKVIENFDIHNVNSPTFSIINEYSGRKKFYHFDFYRINNKEELIDIGFNDYLNDQQAVIFIEWGNLFEEVLPKKRIEININFKENFHREFSFEKFD